MSSHTRKVNIPTIKLNNGKDIPVLGYGTWLGVDESAVYKIEDTPKLVEALSYGIDIGYRHIDTAHLYRVEPEVGEVINRKIKEGVVKREELFITTKLWNHNHHPDAVEAAVLGSLRRLNLDYVDLLLIHWPMSVSVDGVDEKVDYLDTWRALEAVQKKGLARSIGVSNFNLEQLKRLLANCTVVPVVNQIEINLTLGQKEIVDFCHKNNIVAIAYTPFGCMVAGWRTEGAPEPKYENPIMMGIAKKHGKTPTQIALRNLYRRGIVSIPKTLTKSRVAENAAIFDFKLDANDVATLEKFDIGYRTVNPVWWQDCQNYPFERVDIKTPAIPPVLLKWKNGANSNID